MNKFKISLEFDVEERVLELLEFLGYSKKEAKKFIENNSDDLFKTISANVSLRSKDIQKAFGNGTRLRIDTIFGAAVNDAVTQIINKE